MVRLAVTMILLSTLVLGVVVLLSVFGIVSEFALPAALIFYLAVVIAGVIGLELAR